MSSVAKKHGEIRRQSIKSIKFLIPIFLTIAALAGCATRSSYLKIDPALEKNATIIGGVSYLPLEAMCDKYEFDYSWDPFGRKASIRRGPDQMTVMAGSRTILVNGRTRRISRGFMMDGARIMAPVSFVKDEMLPLTDTGKKEEPVRPSISGKFKINTIMLDPGHGGKDPGAIGRRLGLRESEMTLRLSKKVKSMLEGERVRVLMTRDRDIYVPLSGRADIANKSNADLFVSIHINASRSKLLRGFECYFLANTADDNERALKASKRGFPRLESGFSMERSRNLDRTLWDMRLTEDRKESARLSEYICDSVEKSLAMGNRGIKSARFYVLKNSRIPAILVEAGYLSNKHEEKKLKDNGFLDSIAETIARGILKYRQEYERTDGFTR